MTRVLMLSKACIVGIYQRKLEHIAQQGIDLLVLVPPSWRDERGEQKLERVYTQGYRLQTIPVWMNGNFHLHLYPTLGNWMRSFQPHIVHIDEEPYNLATWHALWLARQHRAHSLVFTWQNIHRRYPPPFAQGEQWVFRHIDHLITGTDSAAIIMREKGYEGDWTTIPQFGTDPDLFNPAAYRPYRPFTIGYIGRLVEEKGVEILVEAAAGLAGDWRLHLVGSGPLRDKLTQIARQAGIADRLTIVDWVPSTEMPAQYHNMDVLVLPSLTRPNWKEQFGRVLVEAMMSGVPIIGSNSGAIPGVVGDAGLIVPEGDIPALRDALHRLRKDTDLRQHYASNGRHRALLHFSHERIAAATVDVYGKITSSGRGI